MIRAAALLALAALVQPSGLVLAVGVLAVGAGGVAFAVRISRQRPSVWVPPVWQPARPRVALGTAR